MKFGRPSPTVALTLTAAAVAVVLLTPVLLGGAGGGAPPTAGSAGGSAATGVPETPGASSLLANGGPAAPSPTEIGSTSSPSAAPPPSPLATPQPAPTSRPKPTPTPVPPPAGVPAFAHIYLVVMENREYGAIVGNPAAPYLNGLIARYGLATNYTAVTHPSQPNYLALFSGSTQGVSDNGIHDLGGRNLADQLAARGRSWRVYAQNVPLGCYTGAVASGGPDGPGTYARKHEPAISFTDISRNPLRCAAIMNLSHFDPAAANLELIVPNLCNDMHDCSTAAGDTFLRGFLPRIIDSPAMANSVLFVTWDEGSSRVGGGGRVATIVIGPRVKRTFRSAIPHTHYSLLRTIEDAWGLGCLNASCRANDLREFFR